VDGSELCQVAEGDKADVDKAVEAAENALEGKWYYCCVRIIY
jgi:acyl-CoA reductase-like NAD-dependent aldehyde dehydrogenase